MQATIITALSLKQLKLVNPSQYRFEHLVTQMKWRLQEGRGEAVYQIGVEDNGLLVGLSEEEMRASLKTLRRMAEKYASPQDLYPPCSRVVQMFSSLGKPSSVPSTPRTLADLVAVLPPPQSLQIKEIPPSQCPS